MSEPAIPLPDHRLPESLRQGFLHHWERFEQAVAEAGIDLPALPDSLPLVWAVSDFAAQTCTRYPELLADLLGSGDLRRTYGCEDFPARARTALRGVGDEAGLLGALRHFRHREMLRIAWRDLDGSADLQETLCDLSHLAEACTDAALEWLYADHCRRYGTPRSKSGEPQQLVVLGMGKLGGEELNFSSDIDLIFGYPRPGYTDGVRQLDNQQFFIRLGQRLIRALNEHTADGFVYRVDMRLRPFGDPGPLVMHFDALEDYYQAHGREWERYAMIKARVIAGDRASGRELLDRLGPFVYRRYLDFGAFESLREMKVLINRETERKGLRDNVKLGPGGIREVEFIGQAFQLIRGGRERALRKRGIQPVLQALARLELVPEYAVEQLLTAYAFLRRTENRLQMAGDQQTHALPQEEQGRAALALSMGFDDWAQFAKTLKGHMRRVHENFDQIFVSPQMEDGGEDGDHLHGQLADLWRQGMPEAESEKLLASMGYEAAATLYERLRALRDSRAIQSLTPTGRERLDRLMPLMIGASAETAAPDLALQRGLELVQSVARRSVYLALMVENPMALSQLVRLCAASPWIARLLTQHPILLDELLDARSLYEPPSRDELVALLEDDLVQIDPDDLEQVMDRLRHFKQTQVLKVAAADVMQRLALMRISDQLTWIAEAVLDKVRGYVWDALAHKHGEPRCEIDGKPYAPGFAVIGYGKLGGLEIGYGSDLDLVFLHDSAGARQETGGPQTVDNAVFYARLAQRFIHMLTAHTAQGILYEVDTRLRPDGGKGLMVSSLQAFGEYQKRNAWTWEHQALVRARFITGSRALEEAFTRIRHEVLTQARDPEKLRRDVRDMRERMWRELGSRQTGQFNLKKDPGGIADIEFMVQYMVLAHAHAHPELTEFSDNVRILGGLAQCGLMTPDDAQALADAYRALRNRTHALALQEHETVVDEAEYADDRALVRDYWRRWMEAP
ncbi:MAG: bifunctional [glutamate--ammonia ligase]-adenylyl-L-tyrosine phosphorylase/[glutamate--ammonia-ligase] adenylyltransferase [Gammaproteobacteria bacterium]